MSAYGYERTFTHRVIYVRFPPESGPFSSLAFMSANDPKRTLDAHEHWPESPWRPQHPDWSVGWVLDRQIGLTRGGTRPTVHDGNCGANALRAAIVGNRGGAIRGISAKLGAAISGVAPNGQIRRHKEAIIPIESGLGWRLVWVDSKTPGRVPAFGSRAEGPPTWKMSGSCDQRVAGTRPFRETDADYEHPSRHEDKRHRFGRRLHGGRGH